MRLFRSLFQLGVIGMTHQSKVRSGQPLPRFKLPEVELCLEHFLYTTHILESLQETVAAPLNPFFPNAIWSADGAAAAGEKSPSFVPLTDRTPDHWSGNAQPHVWIDDGLADLCELMLMLSLIHCQLPDLLLPPPP